MLKISFYIAERTIELENNRSPETLTMDELIYWTFQSRIEFFDSRKQKSLMIIPEASLFQIVKLFSDAKKIFRENQRGKLSTSDREGSFDIVVKLENEIVELNLIDEESLKVSLDDFLLATSRFNEKVVLKVEESFPKLLQNKNYNVLLSCLS